MAGLQWRDTSWAALLGREGPCGVGSLWVQQFRYLASRPLPRLPPHTWNTFAFCLSCDTELHPDFSPSPAELHTAWRMLSA